MHTAVITIVNALLAVVSLFAAAIILSSHRSEETARQAHHNATQFQVNVLHDLAIAVIRAHIAAHNRDVVGLRLTMDDVQTMPLTPPHLRSVPSTHRQQQRTPRPPAPAPGSMWSDHR